MPNLEILGQETPIPRAAGAPFIIGGAALLLIFIFRRRPAAGGGSQRAAVGGGGSALEFARISQQAQSEMQRIAFANNAQLHMLDQQFALQGGVTPGLQATEVSFAAFDRLSRRVQDIILGQARRGTAVVEPTATGLRILPTERGIAGAAPPPRQPRRRRDLSINIPGLGGGSVSF